MNSGMDGNGSGATDSRGESSGPRQGRLILGGLISGLRISVQLIRVRILTLRKKTDPSVKKNRIWIRPQKEQDPDSTSDKQMEPNRQEKLNTYSTLENNLTTLKNNLDPTK